MIYLWRGVDQEGEVLESYITRSRDKLAALTFMKKALKRHGSPEAITTDGLRSYKAAMADLRCEQKQEVGALGQQQGGEQPSSVPKARAGDAPLPKK
jgi:putative transposase